MDRWSTPSPGLSLSGSLGLTFFPEHDRERFLAETAATLRACGSEGCFTALTDLMDEWRTTAAVWADLPLASVLSQDIDQPLNLPVGISA